jgi:hypothetical protein
MFVSITIYAGALLRRMSRFLALFGRGQIPDLSPLFAYERT